MAGITLSETARALVRSTFFGKDFDSNVAEIDNFLNLRFGPEIRNNIVASEQGIMLIEMVAFALSTMNWYGDRQIDDTNLRDVRLRSAASVIARQLGYQPAGAVPPVVEITMTLDSAPSTGQLILEAGRQIRGPSGLLFELVEEVVFDIGEVGPKTFAARQGQTYTDTYTSDGSATQVYRLDSIPNGSVLAQGSVRCFVNNQEWLANTFLSYEQTNQFEVLYTQNPPLAVFGDGVAGNIPIRDAEIRFQYFATQGTGGSVPANTVTTFVDPLVAGLDTLTAVLTHDLPSTPGSDLESIRSIKTNAPVVTQAAGRAVTGLDLEGWINSFTDPVWGSVAIGRATSPRSVEQDAQALTIIQAIENAGLTDVADDLRAYWSSVLASNHQANIALVQILAADSVGRYVQASAGLAAALESFLDGIAVLTCKAHVTDGSINLLSVDVSIRYKPRVAFSSQASIEVTKTEISSLVQSALLGRAYGESLWISDLYEIVEALEAVDYSQIAITNNLTRLNSYGDLPIEDYEVITMGVLPVIEAIS